MNNKAMERKIQKQQAIDISQMPQTAAGDYILDHFVDGADYCDARTEAWIGSIAEIRQPLQAVMPDKSCITLKPGRYIASRSSRFYFEGKDPPGMRCVFLR